MSITYKALRPAHINNTHLNVGDTITLHPRAAQFLLADGTLAESTTRRGGAPVPAQPTNTKKGGALSPPKGAK